MDIDFNFDAALANIQAFTDTLFSFNVLVLNNADPDIRVVELDYDCQIVPLLQSELGHSYVQTLVNNRNQDTCIRCPFFRVCMSGVGPMTPINYKLRAFFTKIGMPTLDARCHKAVVLGLATLHQLESAISVPYLFTTTKIDAIDLDLEPLLDMACLTPCCLQGKPVNTELCEIAGLCLPYHVPPDIHFKILQYCVSPTAMLIRDSVHMLRYAWDRVVYTMFLQREPRIPCHIASAYNAATVQGTIVNATRPFLAPLAKENVNASPMTTSFFGAPNP